MQPPVDQHADGVSRRRTRPGADGAAAVDAPATGDRRVSTASTPRKPSNGHATRRRPSKDRSFAASARRNLKAVRRLFVRRTWSLPLLLMVLFLVSYAVNPTESNVVSRFLFLSYRIDGDGRPAEPAQYGQGPWDVAFVAFYTIFLSFTREFVMHELLRPLARSRFCDIRARGKQTRFAEQTYTAVYVVFIGALGMHCMSRTPVWYFNTRGMYEDYPHKTHEATFKFYYLFQAAFWLQQALVMILGIEKRRKDFKELVAHHIVTVSLIALSYRFHFTYIGIAVYLTHDLSDLVLATSKALNYMDVNIVVQGPYFVLTIISWIYFRHYINIRILYSLLTEFRTVGPYELNWETQQYKFWGSNIITFGLLALLQLLNLFWLGCLLRVAYRIVFMSVYKDERSEAEDSEDGTEAASDIAQGNALAKASLSAGKDGNSSPSVAHGNGGAKR
ncbi:hypothetical protein RB595_006941 [Gaeumannomyces hyphopodioides]